mmetsp:Transcript_5416/g.17507  ORF Transcript_5416/g.17507 Transcript_5416/m.17507 type:complete len:387 (+) Transcript_5416:1452-2612(+)
MEHPLDGGHERVTRRHGRGVHDSGGNVLSPQRQVGTARKVVDVQDAHRVPRCKAKRGWDGGVSHLVGALPLAWLADRLVGLASTLGVLQHAGRRKAAELLLAQPRQRHHDALVGEDAHNRHILKKGVRTHRPKVLRDQVDEVWQGGHGELLRHGVTSDHTHDNVTTGLEPFRRHIFRGHVNADGSFGVLVCLHVRHGSDELRHRQVGRHGHVDGTVEEHPIATADLSHHRTPDERPDSNSGKGHRLAARLHDKVSGRPNVIRVVVGRRVIVVVIIIVGALRVTALVHGFLVGLLGRGTTSEHSEDNGPLVIADLGNPNDDGHAGTKVVPTPTSSINRGKGQKGLCTLDAKIDSVPVVFPRVNFAGKYGVDQQMFATQSLVDRRRTK